MALWKNWQESLAATWLRIGKGGYWLRAIGALKDRVEWWVRVAVKLQFPDYADELALRRIGAELQLEWLDWLGEPDSTFRARLKAAPDTWADAGTGGIIPEILSQLAGVFDPGTVHVVTAGGRIWSCDSSGSSTASAFDTGATYDFDGTGRWNQFAIWFGDGSGSGGQPDGGNAANWARRIIDRWRAGHAQCVSIWWYGDPVQVWGGWAAGSQNPAPTSVNQLKWGSAGGEVWGTTVPPSVFQWAVPPNQ